MSSWTRPLFRLFKCSPLTWWSCISGVLIGLQVIGLIIVAIVYYRRQKRRKVGMWLPAGLAQALKKSDRLGMDQWLNIIAMEVCHHGSQGVVALSKLPLFSTTTAPTFLATRTLLARSRPLPTTTITRTATRTLQLLLNRSTTHQMHTRLMTPHHISSEAIEHRSRGF